MGENKKMKVFIQNKVMSLGGSSKVKNEQGEDIFFVKGRVFSLSHVKWVRDMQKNKLFKVRDSIGTFIHKSKAFIYDENKTKIATVKRAFGSASKFDIQSYDGEISIRFTTYYLASVIKNGQEIGKIDRSTQNFAKQFFFGADSFCIEAEEAEIPFLIALVIAMDNLTDA